MSGSPQVLIVGAGPTGLAAALSLARKGVAVRIVDAAPLPEPTSRALGVNPRTLDLLEDTGVTARILAEAQPVNTLRLHYHGRPLAMLRPDWAAMGAHHPMVILPQARSERLLAEALAEQGVVPERGKTLTGVTPGGQAVTATFADGETVTAPLLFAADGAHSVVRHCLGLSFPGDGWEEPWSLIDVDLDGPAADEGWIDFRPDGVLVCLPFSGRRFRLIGFGAPLLETLPPGWRAGQVHWTSAFHISHRMVDRMAVGRIALGGDAAHIHSPLGARGMNLGMEDAFVFAACAVDFLNGQSDRLEDYAALRHPIDAAVVRNVRALTGFVRNTSPLADTARRIVPPLAVRLPFLINRALRVGMGLDHPIRVR